MDVQRRQRLVDVGVYPPQYPVPTPHVQGDRFGATVVQAIEGTGERGVQARHRGRVAELDDRGAIRQRRQAVGGRIGEVHGVWDELLGDLMVTSTRG
jgi:hypothetical protein